MKRTRWNHGATFKARVALVTVKRDKTVAELVEPFSVHPTSKDDGSFEIKDVPVGKHKVVAWHPFAGMAKKIEFDVDVTDGGTAKLQAEIK